MSKDYAIYLVNWCLFHEYGLAALRDHPEDTDIDDHTIGLEPVDHAYNLMSTKGSFLESFDRFKSLLPGDQKWRAEKVFGTLLPYGNYGGAIPINQTTKEAYQYLYRNYFGALCIALDPNTTQRLNEIARIINLEEWEAVFIPWWGPFWNFSDFREFAEEWLNALNLATKRHRGIMVLS